MHPAPPLPHVPGPWLHTLRTFLTDCKCHLQLLDHSPSQPYRQHDVTIINLAQRLHFRRADLLAVNRCRLYLRVTWLSEITTPDGTNLQSSLYNESPSLNSQSTLLWPYQPCPGPRSWATFRKLLRSVVLFDHKKRRRPTALHRPLGPWTRLSDRTWNSVYDPSTDAIYVRNPSRQLRSHDPTWLVYDFPRQFSSGRLQTTSVCQYITTTPPSSGVPISPLRLTPTHLTWSAPSPLLQALPTTRHALDFIDWVHTRPKWEIQLLQNVEFCNSPLELFFALQHQIKLHACSDGSANPEQQLGSFGFVISDLNHNIIVRNWGPATGYPMHSFRTEIVGRLALLLFLIRYQQYFGASVPSTHIVRALTDNQPILDRETWMRDTQDIYRRQISLGDSDVFLQLIEILSEWKGQFQGFHVKGHQDNQKSYDDLTPDAKLNFHADKLATHGLLYQRINGAARFFPLPAAKCYVIGPDGPITSKLGPILYEYWSLPRLRRYYTHKFHWTPSVVDSIAWTTRTSAITPLPLHLQRFLIKLTSGILPSYTTLHRYSPGVTSSCSICGQEETNLHVFQCQQAQAWQEDFIHQLNEWLHENQTHPSIHSTILHGFGDFLQYDIHGYPSPQDDSPQPLSGWNSLLYGFLPSQWEHIQDCYFRQHTADPKFHTGKLWSTQFLRYLWTQLHTQWITRNTREYQTDDTPERKVLASRIETLYSVKATLPVLYRNWLDTPITEVLSMKTYQQQAWLNTTAPVIQKGIRIAHHLAKHKQKAISDYFVVSSKLHTLPVTASSPTRLDNSPPTPD